MGKGIKTFVEIKTLHVVFQFMVTYVRQINLDAYWIKTIKSEPIVVWFQTITPSYIAYVIALVKKRQEMWDQSKRMAKKPNRDGGKKAQPLFSGGKGKKIAYRKSMWNNKGLDYYYTAEQN
jgi:hypothetical protein